jgi:hypothetical protein
MNNCSRVKILFYSGWGPVSQAIRWRTWGAFSHVALCIDGTVYEAREFKGVVAGIDKRNPAMVGIVPGMTMAQIDGLELWCDSKLGNWYDYLSIVSWMIRRGEGPEQWFFCSEFVAEAFKSVGYPLFSTVCPPHKVSPTMVAYSERVKFPSQERVR